MSPQYCDSMFSETLGIFNALEVREVIIPQKRPPVYIIAAKTERKSGTFADMRHRLSIE